MNESLFIARALDFILMKILINGQISRLHKQTILFFSLSRKIIYLIEKRFEAGISSSGTYHSTASLYVHVMSRGRPTAFDCL